jgi:hypothetical protein
MNRIYMKIKDGYKRKPKFNKYKIILPGCKDVVEVEGRNFIIENTGFVAIVIGN